MVFSKNFIKFVSRFSVAGVVVLAGIYFGSEIYFFDFPDNDGKVRVRIVAQVLENLPNKNLVLLMDEEKITLSHDKVSSWLETYTRNYTGQEDKRISSEKMSEYLASIASAYNKQPINARFKLTKGKVEEFVPSEYGRKLNINLSKKLITAAIINGENEVVLPSEEIKPDITLENINKLGITILIGKGDSDFMGSSQARIHNIKVGSAKYNGIILGPGEEFSFNSILGEIEETNGFQSELVIKEGKLVKELGGGLCQVSTTIFRAAIMAGLPILERRPHSFPVKYYNPQGFDATIYPGVVDMRFKNDTQNHILIQSKIVGSKLNFDIYGSDNGRKISIDGPYQYDQKSNGAMKAYFIRKSTLNDGTVKEERFNSNYGAPAPLERNPLE